MAIDMKVIEEMVVAYKEGTKLTKKFKDSLEGKVDLDGISEIHAAMAVYLFQAMGKDIGSAFRAIDCVSLVKELGISGTKAKDIKNFLEKHRSLFEGRIKLVNGSYIVPLKNDNSHSYALNKPVKVFDMRNQVCEGPSGMQGNSITTTRGHLRPATNVEIAEFIASQFCNKLIKELGTSDKKEDYLKAFVGELASKSKK